MIATLAAVGAWLGAKTFLVSFLLIVARCVLFRTPRPRRPGNSPSSAWPLRAHLPKGIFAFRASNDNDGTTAVRFGTAPLPLVGRYRTSRWMVGFPTTGQAATLAFNA